MDEIEITVGGERAFVLRPTLGAAKWLNQRHGGLMNLLIALDRYDLAAAVDVVHAGTGSTDMQAIEEKVYAAGLALLTPDLVRFVILLSHGGRKPDEKDEEEATGERPLG